MHNSTCQHSSPLFFADTLELWRALPSISLHKDFIMEKLKDNIEVIFLITIFISSLSAITPIT
jgi:hypothetical protein|tara:strand:- start:669 stop:857 length:189 start_codon:yes stop_codon:yes gene_type:complete